MAISSTFLYVYSNDGATKLFERNPNAPSLLTVTSNGATITDQSGNTYNFSYTYEGDKTFLGFATSINATEPVYTEGDTITLNNNTTKLYIVEGAAGVTVTYKSQTIAIEAGQTATLHTAGQKLTEDMVISVPKAESGGGGKKYSITYTGIDGMGDSTYQFYPTEIYENQTICIATNAKWYGGVSIKGAERNITHLAMYGGGNLTIIEISNPTSDVELSFYSN